MVRLALRLVRGISWIDCRSPRRRPSDVSFSVLASRALGIVAETRLPNCVLGPLIKTYIAWFDVDMSQVLLPASGFGSLGAFFARKLRADARAACSDPSALVSPCDGVVVGRGRIEDGATTTLIIKNTPYKLQELIADVPVAAALAGGGYCVIYLHPRDYHRVHVPMDSMLREVRHVRGARYPVAPWASIFVDDTLGKNERIAFDLELSKNGKRSVLLMVAAFGVGGIESPKVLLEGARRKAVTRTVCASLLRRGEEIGAFRLGSTVVLLWPKDAIILDESLIVGKRVRAGQRIGRLQAREIDPPVVDR